MKTTLLLLTFWFTAGTFAAVVEGNIVDLTCVYQGGNTEANSITLTIKEKGPIARKNVPSVVPDVFMDEMVEEKYLIREFALEAKIKLSDNGKVIHDTKLSTSFYGGLSFPDIADGFNDTKAFGSYEDDVVFRAFTIDQKKNRAPLEFGLYWSANYATTAGLDCEGTIPPAEIARPGVVKEARYDRKFVCRVEKSKEWEAADFEFSATNLQNERLMETIEYKNSGRKTGSFVHGEGMDDHYMGKFNEGDAQLLRYVQKAGKIILASRYYDECGSWDCFQTEMDLPLPSRDDKKIKGSFRLRQNVRDEEKPVLKARAAVTCEVKAL